MFKVLVIISLITVFSSNAFSKNLCQDMPPENLSNMIDNLEDRLVCKSTLNIGSACAAAAAAAGGGTAVAAKALATKKMQLMKAEKLAASMKDLTEKYSAVQYHTYQWNQIPKDASNMHLAKNTGPEAEAKARVMKSQEALEKAALKLEKEFTAQKDDRVIQKMFANNIEKMDKFISELKMNYSVWDKESKATDTEVQKTIRRLINSLEAAKERLANAASSGGRASGLANNSLRAGLKLSQRVFGSRIFAFLGGSVVGAATLALTPSQTACQSDLSLKYISIDSECRPINEISESNLDFFELDALSQIKLLKKDARVCSQYLDLSQKSEEEDKAALANAKGIQNLSCTDSQFEFQIVTASKYSEVSMNSDGTDVSATESPSPLRFKFTKEGQLTHYCEKARCKEIKKDADAELIQKATAKLSTYKYAASRAFECCNTPKDGCESILKPSSTAPKNYQPKGKTAN